MKNEIQKKLSEKHKGMNYLEYAEAVSEEAKHSELWKKIIEKQPIGKKG
jgi:hypothetical protein